MRGTLTSEQVNLISSGLVGLGEQAHELGDNLCLAGYSAFVPYHRFVESFATSKSDLDIHREYVKERAKSMMSVSDVAHTSPLLAQLKDVASRSRLRNDPGTEWIARLHLDPCEQNAFALKVRNQHEYERRERVMLDERLNELAAETARHATGIATQYPLGMLMKPVRFKFASRVMEQELAPLEFRRVRTNVAKSGVVVSKSITQYWHLDWSIADPDLFYFDPSKGSLIFNLKMRAADAVKTDRDDEFGKVLSVGYAALVYGFSTAYMAFRELDELEMNIKAHMQLYRLVAPVLEPILIEGVQ